MADAYWGNVVLLVHFDGTNGSTSAPDVSYRAHVLTARNGAVLTTTAGDFKFGTAAASVGGSGACFDTPGSADFQFGSGDFTVEAWVKTTDTDGGVIDYITNGQSGSWQVYIEGNKIAWYAGSTRKLIGTTNVNDGTYHHIALTRSGTTLRAYLDGTLEASTTDSTNYNYASAQLSIGRQNFGSPSAGDDLIGKIDEVRITKGVARYTSNFTAPAAAFDDTPVGAVTSLGKITTIATPGSTATVTCTPSSIHPVTIAAPQAVWTQFGTPSSLQPVTIGTPRVLTLVGQATGLSPLSIGTPKLIPSPVSVRPVTIGTPKVRMVQPATGLSPVTVGTPRVVLRRQATGLGKIVTIGIPWTPTTRRYDAAGVSPITFGIPVALPYTPGTLDRNVIATGAPRPTIGTPTASATVSCGATGLSPVTIATPTAKDRRYCVASGIAPVSIGTPTTQQRQRATGLRPVTFGLPVAKMFGQAQSLGLIVKIGTPTYARGNAHHAYSLHPVRIGIPRARHGKACAATGLSPVTIGTPDGRNRICHARSFTPVRVGTPQAVRNPRC